MEILTFALGPLWEHELLDPRKAAIESVIFDDTGEPLPADPAYLERRLGRLPSEFDVVGYAIQELGFVYVRGITRGALLVKFEPSKVSHLAAFAAFYEIAE